MKVLGQRSVPDAAAMLALGRDVAGLLRAGDLLILDGPLGAGKTTFTRGLGEALEVRGAVTSPTFVIARVHPGRVPLVHVDAYRLVSWADFEDLDLAHDVADSITVVEWGAGLVEPLVAHPLVVRIERPQGAAAAQDSVVSAAAEPRLVTFEGDATWTERLAHLAA